MRIRCFLNAILLTAAPLGAVAEDNPELLIETGVLAYEDRNDLNRAKAIFRKVLVNSKLPPRTGAEALWHMAEIYRRQGSDDTSLLVLRKLGQQFPSAPPYTAAAAETAVSLSRDLGGDIQVPNQAEHLVGQDLAHIARAALRLNDAVGARQALQELQDVHESILFELAISIPDESAETIKEREAASEEYHGFLEWNQQVLKGLENESGTTILTRIPPPPSLLARSDMETEDFRSVLYAARDRLVDAVGLADANQVTAAADHLRSLLNPLTDGPKDMALAMVVQGELAAIQKVCSLTAEGNFPKALQVWREARLVYLNSGVAGDGLMLLDCESIPQAMRPDVIAALMYVESALFAIGMEDNIKHGIAELAQGIARLTKLIEATPDGPCRQRLELTRQRLREATASLKNKDTGRAQDLLQTEIYVTP